jgi:hypothetical protein
MRLAVFLQTVAARTVAELDLMNFIDPITMKPTFSRVLLAASAALLAACGGKSDGGGGVTPPATSISVSAGSASLSVAQSANGTSSITVGRVNFTGDVSLTAEGLPTGVTAAFTPASLTSGATSSSLALTVTGAAATGTTSITVRARGTGVPDATTTVALTVTLGVGGTLSITATPATAAFQAGQSTSSLITMTRGGGFASGVNFTVTGAPAGVTTTFSSANPVTADTVRLSVATTTAVVPGQIVLTVRGNAAGVTEATTTFTMTVSAPPSNSITWRFCDPARTPLWFAVQDGLTGTWQRVTETTTGVYNFGFNQPQVGITTVQNEGSRIVTRVAYYGQSEVARAAAQECTENPVPGTKTVTGSFTGFTSSNESATANLGTGVATTSSQAVPNFTVTRVPEGAVELVAARSDVLLGVTSRVIIQRNLNIANNGSLGTLDFTGGSSFAPVSSATLTVTAPNDATIFGRTTFTTLSGASILFNVSSVSSGTPVAYQAIPTSVMTTDELQEVSATQSVGLSLSRLIKQYVRAPTAVSLSMPVDPGAPTVVPITGGAYTRASISGTVPSAFNDVISASLRQPTRRWDVFATAAGRASATAYAFTLPDFNGIAGWQNIWGLGAGSTEISSSFNGRSGAGTNGVPIIGTQVVSFGRFTTVSF